MRHASAITDTVASITEVIVTLGPMLNPPVPFLFVAFANPYAQLSYVHVDHMARSQTNPKTLAGKAVIYDEDAEGRLSALTSTTLACANGAGDVLNRYCCCAEHAEQPVSAC